jgi:tetratricopeptide (TPR) repeat protein
MKIAGWWIILAACCVFCAVTIGVWFAEREPDADAYTCGYGGGNIDLEISACSRILARGDAASKVDLLNAYDNRGLKYYIKKDYDRAIADFEQAIRLDIMNLRLDPFEAAEFNSSTYGDWMIDQIPQLYLMQAVVAGQIEEFAKFPPRKKPASFNLDAVLARVSAHGNG